MYSIRFLPATSVDGARAYRLTGKTVYADSSTIEGKVVKRLAPMSEANAYDAFLTIVRGSKRTGTLLLCRETPGRRLKPRSGKRHKRQGYRWIDARIQIIAEKKVGYLALLLDQK